MYPQAINGYIRNFKDKEPSIVIFKIIPRDTWAQRESHGHLEEQRKNSKRTHEMITSKAKQIYTVQNRYAHV